MSDCPHGFPTYLVPYGSCPALYGPLLKWLTSGRMEPAQDLSRLYPVPWRRDMSDTVPA
jgi:hypothetical protein